MTKPGSRVKLVSVSGGHRLRARLASLGLVPGAEMRVIRNDRSGPFIVAVRQSRVVIGRGMANAIEVAPLDGEPQRD
jgi:Fe2+ transport system protein FeoA